MADAMPKFNAAPAATIPLACARQGFQAAARMTAKYPISEKVSTVKVHPATQTVLSVMTERKELLLAVLGMALVLHGWQFKNLLLCTQVGMMFLYDRVKGNIVAMYEDIQAAWEKMASDAPAACEKEGSDEINKHAKKREEKKKAGEQQQGSRDFKEDAEVAKKALKALSSERVSAFCVEVLAAMMACLLVIHGGVAQKVALCIVLVNVVAGKVDKVIDFPGYEDMESWTRLLMHAALYCGLMPFVLIVAPVAIAVDASILGADLAVEQGVRFLASIGRIQNAEELLASKTSFFAICGLATFGTLWQIWSVLTGGGLAWYFQIIYLPASIAEGFLSLLG